MNTETKLQNLQEAVRYALPKLETLREARETAVLLGAALKVSEISPDLPLRHLFIVETVLPPMQLSPNRHPDAHVYHRYAGEYKAGTAFDIIRRKRHSADIFPLTDVEIEFIWNLGREKPEYMKYRSKDFYYPKDPDNATAALKCAIDALKQSGIIADDSAKHVRKVYSTLRTKKAEHEGRGSLIIHVEGVPVKSIS